MAKRTRRFDGKKASPPASLLSPMIEALEPRLLLSGASYIGAESVHAVDTASWLLGDAGSAYGADGSGGWIYAEDGIIRHNGVARSDIIGSSGATVTDKITKDFTVAPSGYYDIAMYSTLLGGMWSAGDTVIIGGNAGSFEAWLTSRLSGGSLHPHADVEKLYESEVDPASLLIDMGQQAMDNVVDFYEAVGTSGASLPAQYVEAAVGTIKDLIPDESWPPRPVSHTLEMSAYLEAGTTYTWEFGMVSTTIAACIGFGSETCMTDFTIALDDVEILLTEGAPPHVEPPASPSNLDATAQSASQINLTWQDNSFNEQGFRIFRSTSSSGVFHLIDTVDSPVETYTDDGLASGTRYYYKVYAFNEGGDSALYTYDNAQTHEAGAITVTSPIGGETWWQGSTYEITWQSSGNSGNEVWIGFFKDGETPSRGWELTQLTNSN